MSSVTDAGLARVAIHQRSTNVYQADQVAQVRRILQPRHRRLGTQIPAGIRQATAGELERWIGPQTIEVVGVLVAAADREHASAEHIDKAVDDPRRIAPIRDHPGELVGQAETTIGYRQQHDAAIGTDPPAIEGGGDLLGLNGWKAERQKAIVGHGGRGVRG